MSDNEYTQYGFGLAAAKYFEQLEEAYRNSDIDVPLTYNDPGQLKSFVNGTVRRLTNLAWANYERHFFPGRRRSIRVSFIIAIIVMS